MQIAQKKPNLFTYSHVNEYFLFFYIEKDKFSKICMNRVGEECMVKG